MTSRFEWIARMGAHEAYHRSPANRLLHWICIPLELLAVLKLLSLARLGAIDLALVLIAVVGVVYLATDLVAGALMTLVLGILWGAAHAISFGLAGDLVVSVVLFAAAFSAQTQIGHRIFERGIDDTAKNLAELARTKNPIPIVLVFYYHLVELLLAAGYKPSLRRAI